MTSKRRRAEPGDELYEHVDAILIRHDPIGVMPGPGPDDGPLDEYDNEASFIAPSLVDVHTADEVRRVVREDLRRSFSETFPSGKQIDAIAADIWRAIEERHAEA